MAKKQKVVDLTAEEDGRSRDPEQEVPQEKPKTIKANLHAAKVTIDNGVYQIGDVSFGIDPESRTQSINRVNKLRRDVLEQIVVLHGEELEDDVSDGALRTFAASLVQNDWYQIIEGAIPPKVVKNHEERRKEFKVAKKVDKEKADTKKRSMATYRLSAEGKKFFEKMKDGQQKLVYAAIAKLGETNTADVTAAVEKTGKLKTKQQPVKVVGFYVSQGKSKGLIVGA